MYFEFREMFLKNRFFSNMLCTVNITFAYEEEREKLKLQRLRSFGYNYPCMMR